MSTLVGSHNVFPLLDDVCQCPWMGDVKLLHDVLLFNIYIIKFDDFVLFFERKILLGAFGCHAFLLLFENMCLGICANEVITLGSHCLPSEGKVVMKNILICVDESSIFLVIIEDYNL